MSTLPKPPSPQQAKISRKDMEAILGVTTALAAPTDLHAMLDEVINAAKQVLHADRASVWLYNEHNNELVLEVATGMGSIRQPISQGLVGACATTRRLINVPDCYADSRFNPAVDRRTGYHTRCMLTLPLIDPGKEGALVGVMQVLNKADGVFDASDEAVATTLATQCAVALQRVQRTIAALESERARQAAAITRLLQLGAMPTHVPDFPGYDLFATFRPVGLAGKDMYDLSVTDRGLLVVLGGAAGQGITPALSVTQLQAMLRITFALGADLEVGFRQVNDQLARTLPEDRSINAFIGLLDNKTNLLRFYSAGQGTLLHFEASRGTFARYSETSFPLGERPLIKPRAPLEIEVEDGDVLVLLSDGFYQRANIDGERFGESRVRDIVMAGRQKPSSDMMAALFTALDGFAKDAPQEADITGVLVKRTDLRNRR
jgi:phosphoserine phosphatase